MRFNACAQHVCCQNERNQFFSAFLVAPSASFQRTTKLMKNWRKTLWTKQIGSGQTSAWKRWHKLFATESDKGKLSSGKLRRFFLILRSYCYSTGTRSALWGECVCVFASLRYIWRTFIIYSYSLEPMLSFLTLVSVRIVCGLRDVLYYFLGVKIISHLSFDQKNQLYWIF